MYIKRGGLAHDRRQAWNLGGKVRAGNSHEAERIWDTEGRVKEREIDKGERGDIN